MILRLLFLLCVCLPFSAPLQAGWLDTINSYVQSAKPLSPPVIKVLVIHDKQGVDLEVKGKYKIFDPHTKEHISTRFVGKRQFVQAVRDGIKWGEEFPGVHQLVIIPDEKTSTTVIDGVEYIGSIYVYDVDGSISVVNLTFIEDYLSSLLASQFRDPLPEEALAAVTIAARTTAYYQAENPKTNFWDVDGRQVSHQNVAAPKLQANIQRVLQGTRYMIMSDKSSPKGSVSPFLADWKNSEQERSAAQAVLSRITLSQVNEMAQKGENAGQILSKSFPNTRIELIHYLD